MELATGIFANVLILSSMYILIALGFALLFSIAGILHVAHGTVYTVSGYICFYLLQAAGLNLWLSFLLTVLVVGSFGLFLEKFCFRPFFGDFDRSLIVGIGIILILQTTITITTVREQSASLPSFVEGILRFGPISISFERLATFAIGAALLGVLVWFINNTKPGLQMRAIAQDLRGAVIQGININRISALAVVIACGSAAVAGCLMGAYLSLSPFMGDIVLGKALILVILGGMGSLTGIFYAGLLLGTLDATLPIFFSGSVAGVIAMGTIIIVLLIRPTGFLGRAID
jgi:branched-chain amino acid transport system permease protein